MQVIINEQKESIFESIKHLDEDGSEYWLARELMSVLGYKTWENFHDLLKRAQVSLSRIYPQTDDHFRQVTKKIRIGSGTGKEAERDITDYRLTRRACYLIAQNGDPKKESISFAQNYFASQTRKQELREIKEKDIERILARRKLSESEKKFGGVLKSRGIDGKGIAEIKSSGDEALFGQSTMQVKNKLRIRRDKPLADHLPTITIKAKDLATEMTTFKAQEHDLKGKDRIKSEHVSNNSAVRKMLTESGIYPERLPAEEDVKKLERKYTEMEIQDIEDSKLLSIDVIEIDIRGIIDKSELEKIRALIENNPGNSKLKIYYGSESALKILERDIQITPEVINALRKYLIITDN